MQRALSAGGAGGRLTVVAVAVGAYGASAAVWHLGHSAEEEVDRRRHSSRGKDGAIFVEGGATVRGRSGRALIVAGRSALLRLAVGWDLSWCSLLTAFFAGDSCCKAVGIAGITVVKEE